MESTLNRSYGLRENLAIFFRYQRKIKIVFFTTILISIIGSFLVSKVYQASAKILIQQSRESKVISTTSTPSTSFSTQAKDKLLSEIEIFDSTSVVENTVEKLQPEVVLKKMRWRWDWLREIPGKVKKSVYKTLWSYGPSKQLLLWLGKKPGKPGKLSRSAMLKISDNLILEPVRNTDVFVVVFESPEAEFSAQVVNTMVEMYQDFHLDLHQGTKGNKVFSQQVVRLKDELREAKIKLLELKHETGIVSVKPQIQLLLERMNTTQAAMQRTLLERTETELQIKELRRQLAKQPRVIRLENSWTRNPILDSLNKQLSKLEMEQNLYVQGSSSARRLEGEIRSLKLRIENEGQSVQGSNKSGVNPVYQEIQKDLSLGNKKLQGLEQSYSELERQQQEFTSRLEQLDKEKGAIHEQEMDIEVKEQALRLYSKKHEENVINSILDNKKISDVKPIELAVVPTSPAKPRKLRNLILGVIVGLSGGLLIAFLSEYFRRTLANKEEVESVLNSPCLAAFRLIDENNSAEAEAHNIFQLKLLEESVRQINRQKDIRSIFIGSTRDGEGKSMIASALARSLTHKGSRVLLINDGAVMEGSQVEIAQEKSRGLLQDGNIHPTDDNGLLYSIITPATLTETIKKQNSNEFTSFLNKVKDDFDYVIIDAPALFEVPESITLASVVDAVLMVVEAEQTSSITVKKALDLLKEAGASVHGVILNKRTFAIPEWAYNWLLLINKK